MKRILSIFFIFMFALTMHAQRCAVLEFRAGAGISQSDVDGISAIFITYFRPDGYTMVERTQIDRAIDEQGFQRSKMTESQMVRIGQILNVSKIVVGDVNVVMGQYNVDARVINVESGTIAATVGETFSGSSYRSTMQKIARDLASQIAITPGQTVQPAPVQTAEYVDLGLPSGTLWKSSNEKGYYSFDEAVSKFGKNLPTQEQLAELKGMCDWNWTGKGFKVTGLNGNSIFLPASGGRRCDGTVNSVGDSGVYWSSTTYGSGDAWIIFICAYGVDINRSEFCFGRSVRLVQ